MSCLEKYFENAGFVINETETNDREINFQMANRFSQRHREHRERFLCFDRHDLNEKRLKQAIKQVNNSFFSL